LKIFCLEDVVVSRVAHWLLETNGRYLTVLLDGYDEGFDGDNKSRLIIDGIIGCKVLT